MGGGIHSITIKSKYTGGLTDIDLESTEMPKKEEKIEQGGV
jgi:hypothetical protein